MHLLLIMVGIATVAVWVPICESKNNFILKIITYKQLESLISKIKRLQSSATSHHHGTSHEERAKNISSSNASLQNILRTQGEDITVENRESTQLTMKKALKPLESVVTRPLQGDMKKTLKANINKHYMKPLKEKFLNFKNVKELEPDSAMERFQANMIKPLKKFPKNAEERLKSMKMRDRLSMPSNVQSYPSDIQDYLPKEISKPSMTLLKNKEQYLKYLKLKKMRERQLLEEEVKLPLNEDVKLPLDDEFKEILTRPYKNKDYGLHFKEMSGRELLEDDIKEPLDGDMENTMVIRPKNKEEFIKLLKLTSKSGSNNILRDVYYNSSCVFVYKDGHWTVQGNCSYDTWYTPPHNGSYQSCKYTYTNGQWTMEGSCNFNQYGWSYPSHGYSNYYPYYSYPYYSYYPSYSYQSYSYPSYYYPSYNDQSYQYYYYPYYYYWWG